MKSLQESLFDKDVDKQDVCLGELYELSTEPHHNCFSNSFERFMKIFNNKAKHKKIEFLDVHNNFIQYYEKRIPGIASVIDTFLCAPADMIFKDEVEYIYKDYLKPYVETKKFDPLYVSITRYNRDSMIQISIYDNILLSSPNSIQIMLVKK